MKLRKQVALVALAVTTFIGASGADVKPDFSGSYTQTGMKGSKKFDKSNPSSLRVAQTETTIEVTEITKGKPTTNRYMLDGTKTPYITEGGVKGSATSRIKGKTLTLEADVISTSQNGAPTQFRLKAQWTLSSDLKTLTIRRSIDFPNSVLSGMQVFEPWSEIYTRDSK